MLPGDLVTLKSHIHHVILRKDLGIDIRKKVPHFSRGEIGIILYLQLETKLLPQCLVLSTSGNIGWIHLDDVTTPHKNLRKIQAF
jgi:hypothetical protein